LSALHYTETSIIFRPASVVIKQTLVDNKSMPQGLSTLLSQQLPPPIIFPSESLGIRYVMLALNPKKSAAERKKQLPEIEAHQSVNGFDLNHTCSLANSWNIPFVKLNTGSGGMLANWLTKFAALREQVQQRIPFQVMLEDDIGLQPEFKTFVEQQVRRHFLGNNEQLPVKEQVNLVVLGRWGEGYITSLASAARVLHRLRSNGIRRNPDIQFNDGSCGRTIQLIPANTPMTRLRHPNEGDIKRTPTLGKLPSRVCAIQPVRPLCDHDYLPGSACAFASSTGRCDVKLPEYSWRTMFCKRSCGFACPMAVNRYDGRRCTLSKCTAGPEGSRTTPWCDSMECCNLAQCDVGGKMQGKA